MPKASRDPEVSAVVANVPTHVAWAGIDMAAPWRMANIGSTWGEGGEPVPYVPYGGRPESNQTVDVYRAALAAADPQTVDNATIKVENSRAPLLLVCGEADTLWHS